MKKDLIIVRGAGDLASGTIHRLHRCGFAVIALEIAAPSAIRRLVAYSEAVWQGRWELEGVTARLAASPEEALRITEEGDVAVLVDPQARILEQIRPLALVDAILAKKNLGTHPGMAPITVALGPGFTAGTDADAVIETMRGHDLGRVLRTGAAVPNTGIPGVIAGVSKERVIHAPAAGTLRCRSAIGDLVHAGDLLAEIEGEDGPVPVPATIDGVLRGLIRDGFPVPKGFKIADIDPRVSEQKNCFTISDKARCIAGGVLEAILTLKQERGL